MIDFTIDALFMVLLYIIVYKTKLIKESVEKNNITVIAYLYLACVCLLTLSPIVVDVPFIFCHSYNPMVVHTINAIFETRNMTNQFLLNVVMTLPFGFLLPIYKKTNGENCNFLYCTLLSMCMSIFIEITQPLLHEYRCSDITDVIANTLGGMLGYIIYAIMPKGIMTNRITHFLQL